MSDFVSIKLLEYDCQREAIVKTSWTKLNPGRRFYGCRNYVNNKACYYFRWIDEELNSHYKNVINGLLKKINHLEAENARQRRRTNRSGFSYLLCFCVILLVLMMLIK